jgi:hypothetical protein
VIVSRLVCNGCEVDSDLDREEQGCQVEPGADEDFVAAGGRWLNRRGRHYCPTCRRAVEAEDLRTALVAPKKGKVR